MSHIVLKIIITTALVVVISETARRSTLVAGLVASLPVTSVLALAWLYADERDPAKVAQLSTSIFWLVIPSLVLFIVLAALLRRNVSFGLSLSLACAGTVICYGAMVMSLTRLGVKL